MNADRLQEIRREHRHALATHSTPTDSWLNGYQRDVGDLLAVLARLEQALTEIAQMRYGMAGRIARAALGVADTKQEPPR